LYFRCAKVGALDASPASCSGIGPGNATVSATPPDRSALIPMSVLSCGPGMVQDGPANDSETPSASAPRTAFRLLRPPRPTAATGLAGSFASDPSSSGSV
jgi:hypothetical protein